MGKLLRHPLAPLVLFSVALTALLLSYLTAGISPSRTFEIVVSFGWSLLLAFWVVADARRRTGIPCFDFGFFCYVLAPVVIPWYCFWSRGWRGALTLAALVGIWLVPWIAARFVWQIMYG